jgi:hypothetical protein
MQCYILPDSSACDNGRKRLKPEASLGELRWLSQHDCSRSSQAFLCRNRRWTSQTMTCWLEAPQASALGGLHRPTARGSERAAGSQLDGVAAAAVTGVSSAQVWSLHCPDPGTSTPVTSPGNHLPSLYDICKAYCYACAATMEPRLARSPGTTEKVAPVQL